MKIKLKYPAIFILVILLVLVRAYSSFLFYDPLQEYYLNDYLHKSIPKIQYLHFFISLTFRYFINTIMSLGILYLIFKDRNIIKFSIYFYSIAFIGLTLLLFVLLFYSVTDYKILFYVRRLLIHPVFLLILIPAFYQNRKS